mmetsp:Transcript_9328/g.20412  ORF Transcript_9328/g.20412 Transcript_9328/m.20412 type:complete len:110 (-) Transcript_9328:765-1094(-)
MLCRQPQCMASLEAFNPSVPGIDAFEDDADATTQKDLIHIRVQQRNGRKCITTVQGLSEQLDLKKIIKAVKKAHCCNGTIVEDEEMGQARRRHRHTHWLSRAHTPHATA